MFRPKLDEDNLEKLKACVKNEKVTESLPHIFSHIFDNNFWCEKHWIEYRWETVESSTLQWLCEYNLPESEPFLKRLYFENENARIHSLFILVVNNRMELVTELIEEFGMEDFQQAWILVRNPVFNEYFFSRNLHFEEIDKVCMSAVVGDNLEVIKHYLEQIKKPEDLFHASLFKYASLGTVKFLVEEMRINPNTRIKGQHPLEHYINYIEVEIFKYLYPLWVQDISSEELLKMIVATDEERFVYGRKYIQVNSRCDLIETRYPLSRELLKMLIVYAIDSEALTTAKLLVDQL